MTATETTHKINLVEGSFTPSEACDITEALVREEINFHKVQRMQNWVGDNDCETKTLNCRIEDLMKEKQKAKDFFAEARRKGAKVTINGTLEISYE